MSEKQKTEQMRAGGMEVCRVAVALAGDDPKMALTIVAAALTSLVVAVAEPGEEKLLLSQMQKIQDDFLTQMLEGE